MEKKNEDKSSLAIGGATMIGLGVGFIYLQTSIMIFIACLLIGIGEGLVITPFMQKKNN